MCRVCNSLVEEPVQTLERLNLYLKRDNRDTVWDRLTKNKWAHTRNRIYKQDFPAFHFLMEILLDHFLEIEAVKLRVGPFYIVVAPWEFGRSEYHVRLDFRDELAFVKGNGEKRCVVIYKHY